MKHTKRIWVVTLSIEDEVFEDEKCFTQRELKQKLHSAIQDLAYPSQRKLKAKHLTVTRVE